MDFMAIIAMVMSIIQMIMQLIGGGTFNNVLNTDYEPVHQLARHQWSCGNVHWTSSPHMEGNEFTGAVSLECEVQGAYGGGLQSLKNHLENQIVTTSTQVHQGPIVQVADGVSTTSYDSTVTVDNEGEQGDVRGETRLVSNHSNSLHHVFHSTELPSSGNGRFLKSFSDEVQVTPTEREGWYKIRVTASSRVSRPWFVSTSVFQDTLTTENEKRLDARKVKLLSDLASHL